MQWINNFDLFLFDFDGLLVNTEELHFGAYVEMCRNRGCTLDWDMHAFMKVAHFSAEGLREALRAKFPKLQEEPWGVLYKEKQEAYQQLLKQGRLRLLPGVQELLTALQQSDRKRCVVTNSTKEQVEYIQQVLPQLSSIPIWITREFYKQPKPQPDSYLKAMEMLALPGDRTIGFEDSTRGLKALLGAGIQKAILICPPDHPQMNDPLPENVSYFSSFNQIILEDR